MSTEKTKTARPRKSKNTAHEDGGDLLADCRACGKWDEVKGRMRLAEVIGKTVDWMQKRIKDKDFKPTVAEYLKLVQMEQELEQKEADTEGLKEIKVTWVEPAAISKPES